MSKRLCGWHTAQCAFASIALAINKYNLTLGHMRIITDLKKYNTIKNTDKSHGREQSLKVPWEGEIGRGKKERRKREEKKPSK